MGRSSVPQPGAYRVGLGRVLRPYGMKGWPKFYVRLLNVEFLTRTGQRRTRFWRRTAVLGSTVIRATRLLWTLQSHSSSRSGVKLHVGQAPRQRPEVAILGEAVGHEPATRFHFYRMCAGGYEIGHGDSRHEVSWLLEAVLADDVAVQAAVRTSGLFELGVRPTPDAHGPSGQPVLALDHQARPDPAIAPARRMAEQQV